MIVTLAVPDLEISSALVAVTVTVAGDGGAEGAVNVAEVGPAAVIAPIVELPPAIPFTLQVTPVLLVPEKLAVNTCTPLDGTLAVDGKTVIAIATPLPTGIPGSPGGVPAYPHPQTTITAKHSAELSPCILRSIESRRTATRRGHSAPSALLTISMRIANRKVCARAEHFPGKSLWASLGDCNYLY